MFASATGTAWNPVDIHPPAHVGRVNLPEAREYDTCGRSVSEIPDSGKN